MIAFSLFFRHANVLKQVTKLLTGLATPTGQWKEMREKISQRISQHLPGR